MYKRFDAGRREERGSGPCRRQGPLKGHVSEVFLDAVGGQGGIGADGDGELNIVLLGEAVQPVQENSSCSNAFSRFRSARFFCSYSVLISS